LQIPYRTSRIDEALLSGHSEDTDRPGDCYTALSGSGASGLLIDEKKTAFL